MNKETSELFTTFLDTTGLSYRQFADEYNSQVDLPNAISYQTVSNWVTGAFRPHPSKMQLLAKFGKDDWKVLGQRVLKVLSANLIAD